MEARIFNYRSGGLAFVVGFLWVWSGLWLFGVASNWSNPKVTINHRPATPEEAAAFQWLSLAIGIAVGVVAIIGLCYLLFCRIEVAHGYISWYDWRGKLIVRSPVEHVRVDEMNERSVKAYVDTVDGPITVRSGLNDYGMLRHMLEGDQAPRPSAGFVPPRTVYRYRLSYLHIFSFLWLAAISVMVYGTLSDSQAENKWTVLVVVPFALIGIWLQLTGWVERILIGPDGLTWIDFLGRTRVRAQLNQIVSTDVSSGRRGASIQIHTTVGTIRASSYLWHWRELMATADRVVHDAKRG